MQLLLVLLMILLPHILIIPLFLYVVLLHLRIGTLDLGLLLLVLGNHVLWTGITPDLCNSLVVWLLNGLITGLESVRLAGICLNQASIIGILNRLPLLHVFSFDILDLFQSADMTFGLRLYIFLRIILLLRLNLLLLL